VNKNGRKGAVSGFVEFAAESFKKQWWTEQQIRDATIVRCRTLKSILHEIAVGDQFHFDIFSLDVEGAELEALSSLDFNLVSFGIILVESDNHNELKNKEVNTLSEAIPGYIAPFGLDSSSLDHHKNAKRKLKTETIAVSNAPTTVITENFMILMTNINDSESSLISLPQRLHWVFSKLLSLNLRKLEFNHGKNCTIGH
jgi:hypothetical protein